MQRLGRRRLAPSSLRLFRLAAVELERLLGAGGRLVLAALPVEVDDEIPDRGRLRGRRWQDVQHVLVFTVSLIQMHLEGHVSVQGTSFLLIMISHDSNKAFTNFL